jgi:hypothetical protein
LPANGTLAANFVPYANDCVRRGGKFGKALPVGVPAMPSPMNRPLCTTNPSVVHFLPDPMNTENFTNKHPNFKYLINLVIDMLYPQTIDDYDLILINSALVFTPVVHILLRLLNEAIQKEFAA